MNKKLGLPILLIAIVAIAVALFFIFQNGDDTTDDETNGNNTEDVDNGNNEDPDDKDEIVLWSEEYDASKGTLHNVPTESNGTNFTGDAYVAHWNKDDQYVDIEITVPEDGDYTLQIRYSAGAGSASRNLTIDDSFEVERIRFGGTDNWDDFSIAHVYDVPLEEGSHVVSLKFDSSKGSENFINYDQLIVVEQSEALAFNWDDIDSKAEEAQQSLIDKYWNERVKTFGIEYGCTDCGGFLHYWWQAHGVDTLVDGYERSGDEKYLELASDLVEGIIRRNDGITIDYYDDMLWLGLSTIRLYQHTGEERHKEVVLTLWEDILTGWNDEMGGGIAWRYEQLDFKNTPSNAPAVILGARLYNEFGDEEYLEWAERIYDFQTEVLVDPETGLVWDGINADGDGRTNKAWLFTYNHGTYIGANLELYHITNDQKYLDQAIKTGEASVKQFADHNNVIYESGGGDGGLFKGILVRYLTDLAIESPVHTEFADLIFSSAESAWKQAEKRGELLFGASWSSEPAQVVELAQQLSGVMLMEHAAILVEEFGAPTN